MLLSLPDNPYRQRHFQCTVLNRLITIFSAEEWSPASKGSYEDLKLRARDAYSNSDIVIVVNNGEFITVKNKRGKAHYDKKPIAELHLVCN